LEQITNWGQASFKLVVTGNNKLGTGKFQACCDGKHISDGRPLKECAALFEDCEDAALEWYKQGAPMIGGCCRMGPGHIKAIRDALLSNTSQHRHRVT